MFGLGTGAYHPREQSAVAGRDALRHYSCAVCGGPAGRVLFPDRLNGCRPRFDYDFSPHHQATYQIVRCARCTHSFASPRPENISRLYESHADPAYVTLEKETRSTARKILGILARFGLSGRLLDIGCATGYFVKEAERFCEAEGLELSSWAVQVARSSSLVVHDRPLAHISPVRPYDWVTMLGVIEHFEDPAAEIRHLRRLLNPGGKVAVWTGDRDSLLARLLGRHWWWIQGQHLQYFTRRSLDDIFARAGFRPVWHGRYPCVKTVGSLTRSLGRYPGISAVASMLNRIPWVCDLMVPILLDGELLAVYEIISLPAI